MNERLVFVILLGVISVLWYIVGYWRRKAGETAFLAAQKTEKEDERDRLCRLAVRAGHRDACRMFCCLHPDLFKKNFVLLLLFEFIIYICCIYMFIHIMRFVFVETTLYV